MVKENVRYYAPFIFFLSMLLDGQIARVTNSYFHHAMYFHSYLLILAFVFSSFILSRRYLLVSAVILGIMMDSYYVGIIGLYALGLPLIVLMIYFIFQHVTKNLWTITMADILFITFLESALLLVHAAFSFVAFHPAIFITRTLGPTLLFNTLLLLLIHKPLEKLFPEK